eukprot:gene2489-5730_t
MESPVVADSTKFPSIKTRGKDLYLSVPSGRTIVLGRAVEGARYAEDTLDLFELADSVAADQGPTGTAATLRKEIEEAVTTAVQQAGTNLDTAKSDLEAAIAVATKASEDAAAQLATTVAEKAASTEKALTAAAADTKTAIEAAGKASAKERASIADDVKELSGLLQAVLDCNADRQLYNASSKECSDILPPPPPLSGLSEDSPAESCAVTNEEGQDSGKFWILPEGVKKPFEAYCDNTNHGGSWMLIVKIARDTAGQPRWHYHSDLWTDANVLNADEANVKVGDMKNRGYSEMPFTKIKFVFGTNQAKNFLIEDNVGKQDSARKLFTSSQRNNKHGRGQFINAVSPFSGGNQWGNQPNCNAKGFNVVVDGGQHRCRYGISMNNENDCSSNDASIGFGCYSNNNCCDQRRIGAGGSRWSPDKRYPTAGYIWVK